MNDWIDVLSDQCINTSQSKVSRELRQSDGFPSATVINQVINGSYPSEKGRARLQELIEGRYMGVTIECPVLGTLSLDKCAEWHERPFLATNPLRIRMYRACRNCTQRSCHDE